MALGVNSGSDSTRDSLLGLQVPSSQAGWPLWECLVPAGRGRLSAAQHPEQYSGRQRHRVHRKAIDRRAYWNGVTLDFSPRGQESQFTWVEGPDSSPCRLLPMSTGPFPNCQVATFGNVIYRWIANWSACSSADTFEEVSVLVKPNPGANLRKHLEGEQKQDCRGDSNGQHE